MPLFQEVKDDDWYDVPWGTGLCVIHKLLSGLILQYAMHVLQVSSYACTY